jgi:hypothetical protein
MFTGPAIVGTEARLNATIKISPLKNERMIETPCS